MFHIHLEARRRSKCILKKKYYMLSIKILYKEYTKPLCTFIYIQFLIFIFYIISYFLKNKKFFFYPFKNFLFFKKESVPETAIAKHQPPATNTITGTNPDLDHLLQMQLFCRGRSRNVHREILDPHNKTKCVGNLL